MLLNPCALMFWISAWVTTGLPQAVSSEPTASKELPRFQPGCIASTTLCAALAACAGGAATSMIGAASRAVVPTSEAADFHMVRRRTIECRVPSGERSESRFEALRARVAMRLESGTLPQPKPAPPEDGPPPCKTISPASTHRHTVSTHGYSPALSSQVSTGAL